MSEPFDLVCFYADIGRPYLPLIARMTETAKRVMPEAQTILLTPTPNDELCELFDTYVHLQIGTTAQTICYDKARSLMTWVGMSKRSFVLVDPDLEFRKPLQFPTEDVGLLWRGTTAYPVNSGMIFARPGPKKFWTRYGNICASLPKQFFAWWCDQLALAILIGDYHKAGEVLQVYDASVKLMPCYDICARPETATENAWAIHYKGLRKGPEFSAYFGPSLKYGAGTSLPGSAL